MKGSNMRERERVREREREREAIMNNAGVTFVIESQKMK